MIKDNLPNFITAITEMAEVIDAEQPSITALDTASDDMLQEFFVATFTETTAALLEEFVGFEPAPAWPIDRRRDRVKARLLHSSPITPALLEEIIEDVGGVPCAVTSNPNALTATVTFLGNQGVPTYLDDIKKEVELIRPYHIPISYVFTYVYLSMLANNKLSDMAGKTLAELSVLQ